ncbi:hypothetical protein ACFS7Z_27115 [Pontibacter toksunensis]|uniref:Uncharacterized protein n=1 Tax=Pontibacter toksunensis TaxID=1332631 RepID=A0ABW6C2H7_9BACT
MIGLFLIGGGHMPCRRYHLFVGLPLIGEESCLLPVMLRHLFPQPFAPAAPLSPSCKATIYLLLLSLATHSHCLLLLKPTKLHNSYFAAKLMAGTREN